MHQEISSELEDNASESSSRYSPLSASEVEGMSPLPTGNNDEMVELRIPLKDKSHLLMRVLVRIFQLGVSKE